jgi:hypothetical protein
MAQSSSQVTYDVAGKREQGVCFSKWNEIVSKFTFSTK